MIVDKAVKMAEMMNVPILGIVENMSYFKCPDCGGIHHIFGESQIEAIAAKHNIPLSASCPLTLRLQQNATEVRQRNTKANGWILW